MNELCVQHVEKDMLQCWIKINADIIDFQKRVSKNVVFY